MQTRQDGPNNMITFIIQAHCEPVSQRPYHTALSSTATTESNFQSFILSHTCGTYFTLNKQTGLHYVRKPLQTQ